MADTAKTGQYDVLCIGTALLDTIVRGLEKEPNSASGYRAESCSLNVGGEAANESIALSKLGVNAGILCFLGQDMAGRVIADTLRQYGVGTDAVQWKQEHPTPITTMLVKRDGTRQSITNPAHKYNFHPEQTEFSGHVSGAVILGSLFRAPFDQPDVIRQVLTKAKEQGLTVFADTKLPNFHVLHPDAIADCFSLIDYITPNEDEAKYYTGRDKPEEMAQEFLRRGVKNVIIKLGGKGCYFQNAAEAIHLPAFAVQPVDSTGAGDNFLAGFVSEIMRGSSLREALLFAAACGAVCVTAAGANTALKNREQILTFLKQHVS